MPDMAIISKFTHLTLVSFPDAPPTRGKERLVPVTIDAKLGPNDGCCGMRNHNQLGF